MDKKALLFLALLTVCIITASCGSSQAAADARATAIAAEVFATQTAQVLMPSITATSQVTLTPTPTHTLLPKIAFSGPGSDSSYDDIYVANIDGTGLISLLPKYRFWSGSSPAWSPDGTTIAFRSHAISSDVRIIRDIWLVSPDGFELRQLTETDDLEESCPTWSPDGKQLAYKMTELSSGSGSSTGGIVWRRVIDNGIWIISAEGTESFQIASSDSFSSSSSTGLVGCPSWSPDGKQIAFAVPGNQEIFLVNVDGTNITQLAIFANDENEIRNVAWSPDGTRIAFVYGHSATFALDLTTQTSEADWQIYVINLDGNELAQLTSIGTYNSCPSWTPDGAQILFNSDRDGSQEIYIMNADGSHQTRMLELRGDQFCPVWQPSP